MKKIKNAFGRFYLNHPKTASSFKWIAYGLSLFCGISLAISLSSSGSFSEIFLGGIFFFLGLFWFLSSGKWAKKLPEYFISEAEKILESKVVSPKLKSLIAQVKTSKGEDGLNELKNWLEMFEDYKSLEENLPQLYEQQDEVVTEISESISKKNQLRIKLLIL